MFRYDLRHPQAALYQDLKYKRLQKQIRINFVICFVLAV